MRTQTLVIGAGQAGLSVSYFLTRSGHEHLVIDRDEIAGRWRTERWDSFTLVTPNRQIRLPDMAYDGDDPGGFLGRDDVVAYLEAFAATFAPPVRTGVEVTALRRDDAADGFVASTSSGEISARNVVVATGPFHRPMIPACADRLSGPIEQVHSSGYRSPEGLSEGGVLVVGSGQSGAQIAEELLEAGRRVFLATGRAGRVPRRYRGRDATEWFESMGMLGRTSDQLDSPADRFRANPHVSGKEGGRTLNLHRFARQGMTLLGHVGDAQGTTVRFADDLHENIAGADGFAAEFTDAVDGFIADRGLDAPVEAPVPQDDAFGLPVLDHLDLEKEGIGAVVWATGFRPDFSWVQAAQLDTWGYPVHTRGASTVPGLFFMGLLFQSTVASSLLAGVAEDGAHIARLIVDRA